MAANVSIARQAIEESQGLGAGLGRDLASGSKWVFRIGWKAAQIARERRELREIDSRTLRDIGVAEADARIESERFFWDLPKGR